MRQVDHFEDVGSDEAWVGEVDEVVGVLNNNKLRIPFSKRLLELEPFLNREKEILFAIHEQHWNIDFVEKMLHP